MVKTCHEKGVKLGVGFNKRYERITALAKQLADSGAIGRIWYFFVSYFQPEPSTPWYRDWGVTLDTVVHQIDHASWVLDAEPTMVSAEKGYFLGNKGEDKVLINLDFDDKKAIICGGYFRGFPPVDGTHDTCFQILGDRGYILGNRPDKLFLCNSAEVKQLNFQVEDPFVPQLRDFLEAIRRNNSPPVSGKDGLRTQIVIDAIEESNSKRERVPLRPVKEYLSD